MYGSEIKRMKYKEKENEKRGREETNEVKKNDWRGIGCGKSSNNKRDSGRDEIVQ